mmetsp:Transcript_2108/g.7128  ORF Transcript_2108/g.7128 Transcript_2108/m.7128 type:complete len:214 (-) Transcript_2108:339-980(-)
MDRRDLCDDECVVKGSPLRRGVSVPLRRARVLYLGLGVHGPLRTLLHEARKARLQGQGRDPRRRRRPLLLGQQVLPVHRLRGLLFAERPVVPLQALALRPPQRPLPRRRRPGPQRRHLPGHRQERRLLRLQVQPKRTLVHGLSLQRRHRAPTVPRLRLHDLRRRPRPRHRTPRQSRLVRTRYRTGRPLPLHGLRRAPPLALFFLRPRHVAVTD